MEFFGDQIIVEAFVRSEALGFRPESLAIIDLLYVAGSVRATWKKVWMKPNILKSSLLAILLLYCFRMMRNKQGKWHF
jgi:hypothetical protein